MMCQVDNIFRNLLKVLFAAGDPFADSRKSRSCVICAPVD